MTDYNMPNVCKAMTEVLAKDICSVQPMSTEDSAAFALALRYKPTPWYRKPFRRYYQVLVWQWVMCRLFRKHTYWHSFGRGWFCGVCKTPKPTRKP